MKYQVVPELICADIFNVEHYDDWCGFTRLM